MLEDCLSLFDKGREVHTCLVIEPASGYSPFIGDSGDRFMHRSVGRKLRIRVSGYKFGVVLDAHHRAAREVDFPANSAAG